jgi:hypothetical protein
MDDRSSGSGGDNEYAENETEIFSPTPFSGNMKRKKVYKKLMKDQAKEQLVNSKRFIDVV